MCVCGKSRNGVRKGGTNSSLIPTSLDVLQVVDFPDGSSYTINRKFLGRDQVTDVIAFPFGSHSVCPDDRVIGEIVVSAERARRVAKRTGTPVRSELLLYVVHGMLHLLGMHDHTRAQAHRMHTQALHILARHGIRGVT